MKVKVKVKQSMRKRMNKITTGKYNFNLTVSAIAVLFTVTHPVTCYAMFIYTYRYTSKLAHTPTNPFTKG